jgi:UDP-N-acetyl-D-glucosamine/UDP-N-acetyl-D-galactosamine dehydrogenase
MMSHKRKICVIGLGYVGLPVAVCFAKISHVIGFDISNKRLEELRSALDSTNEYTQEELQGLDIHYTSDVTDISEADFYIITVPTPINDAKQPDLSPLKSASEIVGQNLKTGNIVVYESTVYPGATEEYCAPILEEKSGLKSGSDFFIGYSPERINPGDKEHTLADIKKVVSGQTNNVCDIIADVYGTIINAGIHKASSIKVAEAAKVIENTQRDLNIALMNELSLIFEKMDIDTLDVLEAAGTKWNFLPFKPGLVGGHCIGVDPYYLTHKAAILGHTPQVILAGRSTNDEMGKVIANRTIKMMNKNGHCSKDSLITILGLTFKEDVPDLRNSKVTDIVDELMSYDVDLQLSDPVADYDIAKSMFHNNVTKFEDIKPAKAIILAVAHQEYKNLKWKDIAALVDGNGVVFDVKGILPRDNVPDNITLLRL